MTAEDLAERRNIINALVSERQRAGITQRQVARRMRTSQPTVSDFETGRNERDDPQLSTIQRYARAIGCRIHLTLIPVETDDT